LAGIIRTAWLWTGLFWLAGAVVVLLFQRQILVSWKMDSAAGLYLTLVVVLLSVWLPLFWGVLQGKQDFLWLGWSMMVNAFGRVTVAAVAVLALHAYSTGMFSGVLVGIVAAFGIAVWRTRSLWLSPSLPFDRQGLLQQVIPLMVGFLGFQILFTADTLFVKVYFSEADAGFYVGAGTLSRALMWLVLPLAAVMFPRLVHSAVKSEKSNLTTLVMGGTAVLAIAGALGLSLLGPWIVRLVLKGTFVEVTSSLLPWYAFAMVPLAMANVLLNDLLARPASKLIPALSILGLAAGYMVALTRFHDSMRMVLQTMGVFNVLLLGLCAWFAWRGRTSQPAQ